MSERELYSGPGRRLILAFDVGTTYSGISYSILDPGLKPEIQGGPNQLSFVTEGEASLNRCIEKGLINNSIRRGDGVIIVDAGGGTLDISAYALDPRSPGKHFEEIAQPQCHLNGSIFVTEAAGEYLDRLLKGTKYHEDIPRIKDLFDRKTKCAFRNPADSCYVQFGSVRDKNPNLHIAAGKLSFEGKDMASFFDKSVESIISGVLTMRRSARKQICNVFLVSGFSNNGYLFKRVKDGLMPHGFQTSRPDARLNKAVADVAVAGVLDRPVRSRMSRNAFGIECCIVYDSMLKDHVERKSQRLEMYSGEMAVPQGFKLLLHKNTQVLETEEFRCNYTRGVKNPKQLRTMEKEILCYHGSLSADKYIWIDNDPDNYQVVCKIKADLTGIPTPRCVNPRGQVYYKVVLDVILLFGATELKAKIAWKEHGIEKKRDAEVVYNTGDIDDTRSVEVSVEVPGSTNNLAWSSPPSKSFVELDDHRSPTSMPASTVHGFKGKGSQVKRGQQHDKSKKASGSGYSWDFEVDLWEGWDVSGGGWD